MPDAQSPLPKRSPFSCRKLTRSPWFEEFSLDLEPGSMAVLRGPTGSGKTLFLRALADLDPADSGVVLLAGVAREQFAPHEWRRQVLYLRQRPAALAETVRQDYQRVVELHGSPIMQGDLPKHPALEQETELLSGGESQWLALERALLVQPEVLLLDEASSALDGEQGVRFEQRVASWVSEGHAALWVSHDSELAMRLGAQEVSFP